MEPRDLNAPQPPRPASQMRLLTLLLLMLVVGAVAGIGFYAQAGVNSDSVWGMRPSAVYAMATLVAPAALLVLVSAVQGIISLLNSE